MKAIAFLLAQAPTELGTMYSSGKIYVVVGVLAIILAGIVFLLFSMERRVSRLEREQVEDRHNP